MAVIITGGIDLSVGSSWASPASSAAWSCMPGPFVVARGAGRLGAGRLCGLVTGAFIPYVGLPSFVVTLGMLAAARSFAVVLSENKISTNSAGGDSS